MMNDEQLTSLTVWLTDYANGYRPVEMCHDDLRLAAAAIETLLAPTRVVLRTSFATAKVRWNR